MGFEGGRHDKNYGFKGGASQKIWCVKGGHQKNAFKFSSNSSVIMQTSVPEGQK